MAASTQVEQYYSMKTLKIQAYRMLFLKAVLAKALLYSLKIDTVQVIPTAETLFMPKLLWL